MELSLTVSELSAALGVSYQAVAKWQRVPADRVLEVARATGWRDTPHALRPDLYPNPDDGLPVEFRGSVHRFPPSSSP